MREVPADPPLDGAEDLDALRLVARGHGDVAVQQADQAAVHEVGLDLAAAVEQAGHAHRAARALLRQHPPRHRRLPVVPIVRLESRGKSGAIAGEHGHAKALEDEALSALDSARPRRCERPRIVVDRRPLPDAARAAGRGADVDR